MKHRTVTTDHKWLNIPPDTAGLYNYLDCLATARVHTALREEQQRNGQYDHYRSHYWPLVSPIMNMARRGLLVDPAAVAAARGRCHAELDLAQQTLLRYADRPDFNPNSPPQRARLLYDTLELPCGKTTDTGQRSTDQHALDWVLRNLRKRDADAVPAIHALFHRSRWNTILTRYLNLPIDSDGRVRPTIKMGRVETLRLAYADPPLQQFPEEIRNILVAPPSRLFLALDYKQLEARIMAVLSNDARSLQAFLSGEDIHRQNADDLLGPSGDTIQADQEKERDFAKAFVYGIGYGGKAETMKTKLFCPCPRCHSPDTLSLSPTAKAEAEARWYAKHPSVRRWRASLVAEVRSTMSLTTPFGYRRFFHSPPASILPEIYNFPMQATAAGLINRSTIALDSVEAPLALQMHDELVLEVPEAELPKWANLAKSVMEKPVPEMDNYSFPVDIAAGPTLGDLEDLTL